MKVRQLQTIVSAAKQKDQGQFLHAINQTQIFKAIHSLSGKELSQLIYSFAKVEVNDAQYWKPLIHQFLITYKLMNTIDLTMCSYSFSLNIKSSYSIFSSQEGKNQLDNITQGLQTQLIEHKQDIQSCQLNHPNLGLLMYSFLILEKGSEEFWKIIISILKDSCYALDQRNLGMAIYVLGKKEIKDGQVWEIVETSLSKNIQTLTPKTLMLSIYSFSKVNQGSADLWEYLERKAIDFASREKTKGMSGRDASWILWSFASKGNASNEFWYKMQLSMKKSYSFYDFKTFNKCLFSFYLAGQGNQHFWEWVSTVKLDQLRRRNFDNYFDDILYLSKIFQSQKEDYELTYDESFQTLISMFQRYIQPNENSAQLSKTILSSKAPLSHHQILLEKQPSLVTPQLLQAYLLKLQNLTANQVSLETFLRGYIDFTYIIFDLNLQGSFYEIQLAANKLLFQKVNSTPISPKSTSGQLEINDSRLCSGLAWTLYLNLNEAKPSKEHKLELFEFVFKISSLLAQADKEFCMMVHKILKPHSSKEEVFQFFFNKLSNSVELNLLPHLYLFIIILAKNKLRLNHQVYFYSMNKTPNDVALFQSQYQEILSKYKQFYSSKESINDFFNQIVTHYLPERTSVQDYFVIQRDINYKKFQLALQKAIKDGVRLNRNSEKDNFNQFINMQDKQDEIVDL